MSRDVLVNFDGKRMTLSAGEAAEIIERAHAASQWRDISTAPKDGFEILVCNAASDFKPRYVAYWIEGLGRWVIWSDSTDYRTCDPTHWQPLPSPPCITQHSDVEA